MTRLKHILRWLAVLPGAILAALIVMFPIHWAALYIHHFGPFSGPLITDEEGKGLLPSMPLESLERFGDALFTGYSHSDWRSHRASVPSRHSYTAYVATGCPHILGYWTGEVDGYAQRRYAVQDDHHLRTLARQHRFGAFLCTCSRQRNIDHRGVDLISDALPFGRLWYGEPNAVSNAMGYAEHRSRSHRAVIRVYDEAGNVIETHEHAVEFKEP